VKDSGIRSYVVIGSPFGDRRLVARAGVALGTANARYWLTVAPLVRTQLHRWEQRAHAIRDPVLQALALDKLCEEGFTAEVAAMLATIAPLAHRASTVEAIVALEVLYDYLDGLTESPSGEALRDGFHLFRAFRDAVNPSAEPEENYYRYHPQSSDGGYLEELVAAVRVALARLPAATMIFEAAQRAAARGAEAQVRAHSVSRIGTAQLEHWATREAASTALQWREFLAGAASSVLTVHALIAAAADRRTTREQAVEIDAVYLSICVLSTMLDSLIDHQHDTNTGQPGYIKYYEDLDLLARQLASVARHAATRARALPNGAHHVMLLVGVVAYYISAPTARSEFARPVAAHISNELQPLIKPTLAILRAWRLAKRMRVFLIDAIGRK
jgi:tetraprenyl-beta-curcumene synthase